MLNASLSAPSTRNAQHIWLAYLKNVQTLVLEFVGSMHAVLLEAIIQTVFASRASLEIPFQLALGLQQVSKYLQIQFKLLSYAFLEPPKPTESFDPCNPSPCGSNAICQRRQKAGACQCIPEYFGDPYVACRPECVVHSDCPSNKACQRNKCIDPCPGTCGINARCRVMNHVATCTCIEDYIGDPFTACKRKPLRKFQ